MPGGGVGAFEIQGTTDVNRIEAPITIRAYLMCAFAAFGGIFFGYDTVSSIPNWATNEADDANSKLVGMDGRSPGYGILRQAVHWDGIPKRPLPRYHQRSVYRL